MNQDNLTTVITSQGHAQDIPNLEQLSIPVDQLVAALDEVVTQPLSWREEKKDDDKDTKDADHQPQLLAAADTITVAIPMAPAEGRLQNIDTSYQSGYSGYDGGNEGLPPVAVFGLGLLAVAGIAAALSGGGGGGGGGGNNPPVNNDPILGNIPSPIATNEDQPVTFNVSSNDPDGDTITTNFSADNGTVNAIAGNPGQFQYTPDADFNGTDEITVTISDGNGGSDSQTIVVNVSPVNDAPEAATLNTQTANGQTVIIDATTGATDPEGDPLTFQLGTGPSNGSVNIIAGSPGQFEYIPNQGFSGVDSFTVTISDDKGASISRTIQVQVGGNIAPEADAEQDVTLAEDTPTTIDIGATDANGDPLSYEITASPDNGSVESTGVPGEYEYTPNSNFSGSDSFTVTVTDGLGGSATQIVNLTITAVNDAPEADAFQNVTLPEGGSANIQVDATDVEGDALSYAVVTDPANGTVTNNGGGSFTYTPTDGDFIGQDSFEVEVSDGNGGTTTQEVRITVNADNDAPQVDATQDVSTESAAPVTITVNATDAEGDTLSYGAGAASNGSVVPGSAPGQFIYRPDAGFDGEDSFDVFVSDGNGGVSTQTVTVTVADSEGTEYDLTPLAGPAVGLTDEADIISGSVSATGSTLNAGDSIDGQGGFDSLQISQSVDFTGFGGANPLAQGSMSNVEGLEISNNAGTTTIFNATGASGLEYIYLDANDESFTFNALSDTNLTFEIADADSVNPSGFSPIPTLTYQLNFNTDVNDGEDDSLTLILNDVGRRNASQGRPDDGIQVNADDIEHIAVVAKSGQNFINLQNLPDVQTLTIGGTGDLDTLFYNPVGTSFSDLSVVDGSSALGDLDLALYSDVAMMSLRSGFGDDVLEAGNNIRSTTVIDGGDGDDLLKINGIDDVAGNNEVTLTPQMSGVETLDLVLDGSVDVFTLSLASTTGLTRVQVSNEMGIDDDAGKITESTIRDLDGRELTLAFSELAGDTYDGNDLFVVQDSGDLTIATESANNNSSGSFADEIVAVAAEHITLNVGEDTTFSGVVMGNSADQATINMGAGSAIDNATLSLTSADEIEIDGATDTIISDLSLLAENVSTLTVTGSARINGLGDSNLNSLANILSSSLGGLDLTFAAAPGAESGIGAFVRTVTIDTESAVVAADGADLGLAAEIADYAPGNGIVDITGSNVLDNNVIIGEGRNQITVSSGSGDDSVTLMELFENGDGSSININLGNGVSDTLTLATGDNQIESMALTGVEEVIAGAVGDELEVNASSVNGDTVEFTDFSSVTFFGTDDVDNLDYRNVAVAAGTETSIRVLDGDDAVIATDGDDIIEGGEGADVLTGRQGDNTYVYNTGDVVDGEIINFSSAPGNDETLLVESSTDFSLLNGGTELELLDRISIEEGQEATFLVEQLSGDAAPDVEGTLGGDDETLALLGTDAGELIDLNVMQFQITVPVTVTVNAGAGADEIVGRTAIANTFIFNTGDVATGETLDFGVIGDTFIIESDTNFSALNGGNTPLAGLTRIELDQDQSAIFNAIQLNGLTLTVGGDADFNSGETITVLGTTLDDNIDLSGITVDTRTFGPAGPTQEIQRDVSFEIYGLEDDDRIVGTNGDDLIDGAGGLDTITGGAGADSLYGGINSDTFVHSLGDGVGPTATADLGENGLSNGDEIGFGNGVDKIFDFTDGSDFIDLDVGGAQLKTVDATQAFDVDLVDFGLSDDEYVVIRGNFDGTNDDVFYVNDQGDDLLFAFDANAQSNANPGIDTVNIEFIGLIGLGGVEFNASDVLV